MGNSRMDDMRGPRGKNIQQMSGLEVGGQGSAVAMLLIISSAKSCSLAPKPAGTFWRQPCC